MSGEPMPGVHVDGVVPATPGQPTTLHLRVRNEADQPRVLVVSVVGLDPTWAGPPLQTDVLGPHVETAVTVSLAAPAGTPSGRYPFVVAVQALHTVTSEPIGPAAQTNAEIVVGDVSRLAMSLQPAQPEGVYGRRVTVVLDNHGTEPVDVELAALTATGLRMRLRKPAVTLPARGSARVRARLSVERRRLTGQSRRMPFVLTAQGRTTPLRADGVFIARPMFSTFMTKAVALLAVLSLWAAAAAIGLNQLSAKVHNDQQHNAALSAGNGNGGSGSKSGGSGGSGGGSGSNNGGKGSGSAPGGSTASAGQRINGTVTGPTPGGVTVTLRPTSLVNEQAEGTQFVGVSAPTGDAGKLPMQLAAFSASLPAASTAPVSRSTTTQADGTWAFAGVKAPGYYLLTFAKPGYQTARYVVSVTAGGDVAPLTVPIDAGRGHLTGTVTGPQGPVGGVDLTITDGTVTVSTSTQTTGNIGSWSMSGLSTPGSYLVTASRNGYSTESTMITLGAGASVDDVAIALKPGVEALVGTVSAPDDSGTVSGLGGATVTVTDGKTTRTATTVTDGPVGAYTLPDLPVPSTYTVTISADGFAPRTQQVKLGGSAPKETVDALMTSSTGTVTGTVNDSSGAGIIGAGLVLTGDNGTYKTTSVSDPPGSYQFTGVPPGSYVLSGEKFGKITNYASVDVTMGAPSQVNLTLHDAPGGGLLATAHIRGKIVDARTGGIITCDKTVPSTQCVTTISTVDRRPDGDQRYEVTAAPGIDFVLPPADSNNAAGLLPGLHTLTFSAPGYETATVNVQVPEGATVDAPTMALAPEASITGTITASVGDVPAGTCVLAVPYVPGTTTAPTAPPCTPDQTTGTTCTAPTDGGCAVVGDLGAYQITGLVHGPYWVYVIPTATNWLPVSPVQLTLGLGETKRYDARLDQLGWMDITVQVPNATGQPGPPGVAVPLKITPSGGTAIDATTDTSGLAHVVGLQPGTYDVTADNVAIGADQQLYSGAATGLSVGLNKGTPVSITLVRGAAAVVGRVLYLLDANPQPLGSVQVQVTGITGYNGSTPISQTVPVTTDDNGCFALDPVGGRDITNGPQPCTTVAAANVAKLPLIVSQVHVEVDAPSYADTIQDLQAGGGSLLSVVVRPPATPITSADNTVELSDDTQNTADRSAVVLTVTQTPPGVSSVTVTSSKNGALTWQAPGLQSNQLPPGTYVVRASLANYDDATATFTVNVSTTPFTVPTLTLVAHNSLSVTAQDTSGQGVNGAIFILTGPNITATTVAAAPGQSTVVFPNLSPAVGSKYQVAIHAAGFQFQTFGPYCVVGDTSSCATNSYTAALTPMGSISGTVEGQAGPQTYPLAGVVVTAALANGQTFTTVSAADGTYRITGTTVTEGLVAGSWTVTASTVGYTDDTKSVTVTANTNSTQPLVLNVTSIASYAVTVTDGSNNQIGNATVTLTDSSGSSTSPSNTVNGVYTFTGVPPTQYTLSVTAANYAPLVAVVTLQIGVPTQSITVTLASFRNGVTVTVNGQSAGGVAVPLSGATVTMTPSGGSTVTHTSGTNQWTFSPVDAGTYTISVSNDGYLSQTLTITLTGGQVANVPVTLYTVSHAVTLTVESAPGADLRGATVALVSTDSSSPGQAPQQLSPVTAGVNNVVATTFNQVPPGSYIATVTGPDGRVWGSTDPFTASSLNSNPIPLPTLDVELLTIKVTDVATGLALPASVSVSPTGSTTAIATLDGLASYTLIVPLASYSVTAHAAGYEDGSLTNVTVATGTLAAEADLTLKAIPPPTGTLVVTVTYPGSTPLSGASVTITGPLEQANPAPLPSGTTAGGGAKTDGKVTFGNLLPGTYNVSATYTDNSGSTPVTVTGSASAVSVGAGSTATVTIALSAS